MRISEVPKRKRVYVRDRYRRGRAHWHYVYQLADPRNDEVFYIGKGSGERIKHHYREAMMGVMTPKCIRIREIVQAGFVVDERIIGLFQSNSAATKWELENIHAADGNLTNGLGAIPVNQWIT